MITDKTQLNVWQVNTPVAPTKFVDMPPIFVIKDIKKKTTSLL
jgi:hypothetical protein